MPSSLVSNSAKRLPISIAIPSITRELFHPRIQC
jgi:hypothetical protein